MLRSRDGSQIIIYGGLIFLCFVIFYPLISMGFMSLKSSFQFYQRTWLPTIPFQFDNYILAFQIVGPYIVNTIYVAALTSIGAIFLSSLSAFVFARFHFPGKQLLFYLIISLMMIPGVLNLVPQYMMVRTFGLLNTRWVLILPGIAGGQVFGIFLLRSFFAGIPDELFECARMDGATTFYSFRKIALPLARSILLTLVIMNTLNTWNAIVWPLVTLSDERLYTVSVGLAFFNESTYEQGMYGPMFAGYIIISMPLLILFIFANKQFVSGLTSGAIKL